MVNTVGNHAIARAARVWSRAVLVLMGVSGDLGLVVSGVCVSGGGGLCQRCNYRVSGVCVQCACVTDVMCVCKGRDTYVCNIHGTCTTYLYFVQLCFINSTSMCS